MMYNMMFLQQMRTTVESMAGLLQAANGREGAMQQAWLDAAAMMRETATVLALASIAESLTLIASQADCLTGIEEMLNDVAGTLVTSDLMSVDEEVEDGPGVAMS